LIESFIPEIKKRLLEELERDSSFRSDMREVLRRA